MKFTMLLLFASILFIIISIFAYLPLHIYGIDNISSTNNNLLIDLRNAYSILASIFTLFFSSFGLFLGAIYYLHRHNVEEKRKTKDRSDKYLDFIREKLDNYDRYISSLLLLFTEENIDKENFEKIRDNIHRTFDNNIYPILGEYQNVTIWKEDDCRALYELHSFVDKYIVNIKNYGKTEYEISRIRDDYYDKIFSARRKCIC